MKISELDKNLRPREKAKRYGLHSLDTSEIIALIIGSGVKGCSALDIGRILLSKHHLSSFLNLEYGDLINEKGFKDPTVWRFLGALELLKRINKASISQTQKIDSLTQVVDIYNLELSSIEVEVVVVLMLNYQNRIIKEDVMFQGSSLGTSFNPADLFKSLLKEGAKKFYILHNHPGGTLSPSTNDIKTTLEIIKLCKSVGIKLMDHIIISNHNYFSFKENHLI